jgi:predicted nucleotidyltransferase
MHTRVDKRIRSIVEERLTAIERDEDVRVLFACESGSRAWGFASANSDYDVRFLYLRRPEWYL